MTITLSQDDCRSFFWDTEDTIPQPDAFDTLCKYPTELGHGFLREIDLRDGLTLAIADYQCHDDIITKQWRCCINTSNLCAAGIVNKSFLLTNLCVTRLTDEKRSHYATTP